MSIEAKLDEDLKSAMRAKDADKVACIRHLRAKVQEAVNAPGFRGPTDDAFYRSMAAAYVRQLQKALGELELAGDRGKELRDKYGAEIAYLSQYLPKLLDEQQTRALVAQAVAAAGAREPREAGKVIGALMKEHKGELDPALARRLVEEALRG